MFGGFQVGPFQPLPAFQQETGAPVVPGAVGGGGGGHIWYWPSKRSFRKLEDIIDDGFADIYREILETKALIAAGEAGRIVKPFVETADKTLRLTPAPESVNWTALASDAIQARKLFELWVKAVRDREILDEDDDLMLLH